MTPPIFFDICSLDIVRLPNNHFEQDARFGVDNLNCEVLDFEFGFNL